ncbi:hypothetical protein PoB_006538700 [Plakobranchus ocellatus]|uniref:Uncharacterized protein n=1 Tax=Plakobranchus ocellatus TaxID=259542 RepID=A0AAV4D3W9_9GAST|nr:hypothetical protein PoB_006538700 [Plakobranchus ocellatus]
MASLQSSRTQCCCCAIGVFAAMFGVFMLSAGICIVVNVGMEVDTSGLPSNLHNENGQKIVGIILICVAVATLALSASVGFVYFVVCNRKPQNPSPAVAAAASRGGGSKQQGSSELQHNRHRHHHHSGSRGVNGAIQQRAGGAASPADGRLARLLQPERTRSRDSVRTGSQPSLRSAASSMADASVSSSSRSSPHAGRPPNSRYHPKRSHHKSRGLRPNVTRYKLGLEPHLEEDVEAAKSVVDLKRTDAYDNSNDIMTSTANDLENFQPPQAWSEDGQDDTELDQTFLSASSTMPPTIVLNDTLEERHYHQLHPSSNNDSLSIFNNSNNTMETQLLGEGNSSATLGDTLNNTTEFAPYDGTYTEDDLQVENPHHPMFSSDISQMPHPHGFDKVEASPSAANLDAFTAELDSIIDQPKQDKTQKVHHAHNHDHGSSSLHQNNDSERDNLTSSIQLSSDGRPSTHPPSILSSQAITKPSSLPVIPSMSSMSSSSTISLLSSQSSSTDLLAEGSHLTNVETVTVADRKLPSASAINEPKHSKKKIQERQDSEDSINLELESRHGNQSKKGHHRHHRHHRKDKNKAMKHVETELQTMSDHQNVSQNPQAENRIHATVSKNQQEVQSQPLSKEHLDSSSLPKFNAAFSTEGGDPDPEDAAALKEMQEYMKQLMDESEEV